MTPLEPFQIFSLAGRVAVVTGGTRGIGRDAAEILALAGADVAITSRDGRAAEATAREIAERASVQTMGLELDHTEPASVERATQAVNAWRRSPDILLNNAGGGSGDTTAELFERDPEDIKAMLASNLLGPLLCARAFGRAMAERGSGKIINLSSIAAHVGRDRSIYEGTGMMGQPIDYAAAKGGVSAMTRDLAAWLGPKGVTVNAISPGGIERDHPEAFVRGYAARTPLGRMARPGFDIAGPILFLASKASDYVNGHDLVVDGGFSTWA